MSGPGLDNRLPFAVQPMHLADESGRPLLAVVVKATCAIAADGSATLLPEQPPVDLAGSWWGEPGASSPRIDTEAAFCKPATDVAIIGHAHAPHAGCTQMEVHGAVGPLAASLRVTGDRVWRKGWLGKRISEAQPFERLPLTYERAFGGVDGPADDPTRQIADERNPLGRGFRSGPTSPFIEGLPLPNIEAFDDTVTAWGQPVAVAGMGFLAAAWQPRRTLAGTYDEAWRQERLGLLPRDFDRRFFNAAHPQWISREGHLRGDEAVRLQGLTPTGDWAFRLPGWAPPAVTVARRMVADVPVGMVLDTVVIDADALRLTLLWRGHIVLRDGPLEVSAVVIDHAAPGRPSTPGA